MRSYVNMQKKTLVCSIICPAKYSLKFQHSVFTCTCLYEIHTKTAPSSVLMLCMYTGVCKRKSISGVITQPSMDYEGIQ